MLRHLVSTLSIILWLGCFSAIGQTNIQDTIIFKFDRNVDDFEFRLQARKDGPDKGKIMACYYTFEYLNGSIHGVGYSPFDNPIFVRKSDLEGYKFTKVEWFHKFIDNEDGGLGNYIAIIAASKNVFILEETLCEYDNCLLYPAKFISGYNYE